MAWMCSQVALSKAASQWIVVFPTPGAANRLPVNFCAGTRVMVAHYTEPVSQRGWAWCVARFIV
jgi:hypothetical protein